MYISREVRVSHGGGGGGGRGEERKGGWVATVPCQALRGRLFIPWICIFCPLPFLTSCYPASMISSVGSSYCSRSSTRHSLCLRSRPCVSSYVCMCQDICSRTCVLVDMHMCMCVSVCVCVYVCIASTNSQVSPRARVQVEYVREKALPSSSFLFSLSLSLSLSVSLWRVSLHFNRVSAH